MKFAGLAQRLVQRFVEPLILVRNQGPVPAMPEYTVAAIGADCKSVHRDTPGSSPGSGTKLLREIINTISAIPVKTLRLQQRIVHNRVLQKLEQLYTLVEISEAGAHIHLNPEAIEKLRQQALYEMEEFIKELVNEEYESRRISRFIMG